MSAPRPAPRKAAANTSERTPRNPRRRRLGRRLGWTPDAPDERDLHHEVPPAIAQGLPPYVDLRPLCPPVYNQGRLDCCTANALAAAIAFERAKLNLKERFTPSRLFIYYNERVYHGTVAVDSGAPFRDGMKAVNKVGVCPEDQPDETANWPFDPTKFAIRPPDACYDAAHRVRALRYRRVHDSLDTMKGCLAEGYPFVFGILVYESFISPQVAKTGLAPLPAANERLIGGHAVMAVGYDDQRAVLIVRNSWGSAWGDHGYFYVPYAFVGNPALARDFWTIRLISKTPLEPEREAAQTAQTADAATTQPSPTPSTPAPTAPAP